MMTKEQRYFWRVQFLEGQGASGFPTIAQIVKRELDVKLGGALLLPYFKFMDDGSEGELKAKSDEFLTEYTKPL